MTDAITLYTKAGCHLCEDGEWMLEVALRGRSIPVRKVDITADPALSKRYSLRVPVLRHPARPTELAWPFTPESILDWLDGATD